MVKDKIIKYGDSNIMKNQDIDKLFRDHFDNLDIQPGTDIWKKIELDLDEEKVISIKKKTNWLNPLITTAAILICIGIFSLLLLRQSTSTTEKKITVALKMDKPAQDQQIDNNNKTEIIDSQIQIVATAINKAKRKKSINTPSLQVPAAVSSLEMHEAFNKVKMDHEQPIVVVVDAQAQLAHAMDYIPIKPLIENPDEEDSMMAAANDGSQTIVTKVLNILSKTINQGNIPEVQFSNDDEGSLQIDLFNSMVKNKKRKK